jgi:putative endopeptidase
MKNFKIAFAAAILIVSCNKKEEFTSGINTKNMDTIVKPGDNFANYVNGTWTKNTKIPADKASYGAFDLLFDKSQIDVKAIIENAVKSNNADGSDEQKIGDCYASFMNRKDRDAKGISPIVPEMKNIDALANYSDLAAYFGKANRTGGSVPFQIAVNTDFKNPKEYSLLTMAKWFGTS